MYDLLFESASTTLLEFGENPKRLGARIGFYGILHTWGEWVEPQYNSTFLFSVRALSNVFRAKFLNDLITAQRKGLLKLPGDMSRLTSSAVEGRNGYLSQRHHSGRGLLSERLNV